ncbi:MAG: hypothetical protein HY586_02130, partial [Candidatus Omnitrophica bacterium]|nr:hypothetical protein [Candidatus Omnitrophota bacterium]
RQTALAGVWQPQPSAPSVPAPEVPPTPDQVESQYESLKNELLGLGISSSVVNLAEALEQTHSQIKAIDVLSLIRKHIYQGGLSVASVNRMKSVDGAASLQSLLLMNTDDQVNQFIDLFSDVNGAVDAEKLNDWEGQISQYLTFAQEGSWQKSANDLAQFLDRALLSVDFANDRRLDNVLSGQYEKLGVSVSPQGTLTLNKATYRLARDATYTRFFSFLSRFGQNGGEALFHLGNLSGQGIGASSLTGYSPVGSLSAGVQTIDQLRGYALVMNEASGQNEKALGSLILKKARVIDMLASSLQSASDWKDALEKLIALDLSGFPIDDLRTKAGVDESFSMISYSAGPLIQAGFSANVVGEVAQISNLHPEFASADISSSLLEKSSMAADINRLNTLGVSLLATLFIAGVLSNLTNFAQTISRMDTESVQRFNQWIEHLTQYELAGGEAASGWPDPMLEVQRLSLIEGIEAVASEIAALDAQIAEWNASKTNLQNQVTSLQSQIITDYHNTPEWQAVLPTLPPGSWSWMGYYDPAIGAYNNMLPSLKAKYDPINLALEAQILSIQEEIAYVNSKFPSLEAAKSEKEMLLTQKQAELANFSTISETAGAGEMNWSRWSTSSRFTARVFKSALFEGGVSADQAMNRLMALAERMGENRGETLYQLSRLLYYGMPLSIIVTPELQPLSIDQVRGYSQLLQSPEQKTSALFVFDHCVDGIKQDMEALPQATGENWLEAVGQRSEFLRMGFPDGRITDLNRYHKLRELWHGTAHQASMNILRGNSVPIDLFEQMLALEDVTNNFSAGAVVDSLAADVSKLAAAAGAYEKGARFALISIFPDSLTAFDNILAGLNSEKIDRLNSLMTTYISEKGADWQSPAEPLRSLLLGMPMDDAFFALMDAMSSANQTAAIAPMAALRRLGVADEALLETGAGEKTAVKFQGWENWLTTLPPNEQARAISVIRYYAPSLNFAMLPALNSAGDWQNATNTLSEILAALNIDPAVSSTSPEWLAIQPIVQSVNTLELLTSIQQIASSPESRAGVESLAASALPESKKFEMYAVLAGSPQATASILSIIQEAQAETLRDAALDFLKRFPETHETVLSLVRAGNDKFFGLGDKLAQENQDSGIPVKKIVEALYEKRDLAAPIMELANEDMNLRALLLFSADANELKLLKNLFQTASKSLDSDRIARFNALMDKAITYAGTDSWLNGLAAVQLLIKSLLLEAAWVDPAALTAIPASQRSEMGIQTGLSGKLMLNPGDYAAAKARIFDSFVSGIDSQGDSGAEKLFLMSQLFQDGISAPILTQNSLEQLQVYQNILNEAADQAPNVLPLINSSFFATAQEAADWQEALTKRSSLAQLGISLTLAVNMAALRRLHQLLIEGIHAETLVILAKNGFSLDELETANSLMEDGKVDENLFKNLMDGGYSPKMISQLISLTQVIPGLKIADILDHALSLRNDSSEPNRVVDEINTMLNKGLNWVV